MTLPPFKYHPLSEAISVILTEWRHEPPAFEYDIENAMTLQAP